MISFITKVKSRFVGAISMAGFSVLCLAFGVPCQEANSFDDNVVRYNQPQLHLNNAGFELGQIGWKPIALNLSGARVVSDSLKAHAGRRSLKIDLSSARQFDKAEFRVASPWINLPRGGTFTFSVFVKADMPRRAGKLSVINAVSRPELRSGKKEREIITQKFRCGSEWKHVVLQDTLPEATNACYRLVIEFEAPGIYWIDDLDFRHRGQSICLEPELEAGLEPEDLNRKLPLAPAEVPVRLWIANRSATSKNFEFRLRQTGRLHQSAEETKLKINSGPQQASYQSIKIKLAHADDYRLEWQLLDEQGRRAAAGVLRLAAASAQIPVAPPGDPVWGMHLSALNMDLTLPILRQAGVMHVRNFLHLYWNLVEPKPGQWQWPDDLYQHLRQQGFQPFAILGFPPRWASAPASPSGKNPFSKMPRSMDEFRDYIRAVVIKYGDGITCWEIWNEPNLERFFDGTPAEYAQLLEIAVNEIKTLQPRDKTAGLSLAWGNENRTAFMQAALQSGDAKPDAASFHPYETTGPEAAQLPEKILQLQQQFTALKGYAPELWATEIGYRARDSVNQAIAYFAPASARTVAEMTQAAYLVRHALLAKSAGVKYYFCYSMDSERPNSGPDIHGLLDYDWTASVKPALLAYLTLAQICGDAVYESREALGEDNKYFLHFRRGDGRKLSVCWQASGASEITLPHTVEGAEAFDLFGNRIALTPGAPLRLTTRPIYFLR